jgi:hypothetical protein
MIKCPKEFYKLMQDNEDFIKALKELNENKLNMEVSHEWFIKIFNDKWASERYSFSYINNLLSYNDYEKELKEFRNEAEVLKKQIDIINSKTFKCKVIGKLEILQMEFEDICYKIDKREKYLGLKSKKEDEYFYTYAVEKELNEKYPIKIIKIINDLIKEYKAIKFCTEDIILY